ncbi:MAG: hypothetical protein ABIG44_16760 [Planctomycetota bacterium]
MSPQQHILEIIATIRRHWHRRQISHALLLGLTGLLGWLLAMIVLDNLAMLSSGHLILGWLVFTVAALAWLAMAGYRLVLRPPAADGLALLYEARLPGQQNRLINALQFMQSRAVLRDPIAHAALIENAAALDVQTAPRAVDWQPVRRALIILAISVVLLGSYGLLRPRWTGNALTRLLHPLSPSPHLLSSAPAVSPGDVELTEGTALRIEATVPLPGIGRRPAATLEYRLADLDWVTGTMARNSADSFTYDFDSVRHPLVYRVRAGRSVSSLYRVTLQYRPRIEQLRITVTPPEYVDRPAHTFKPNVGDVTALAGSSIELAATASVSLSRAELEFSDGTTIPLTVSGDQHRQLSGGFTLTRGGSYAPRITDLQDLTNIRPPRYTLTVEPDQPPLAIVKVPGRDLILPANAEIELAIEAEDDIGLSRVALQMRWAAGEWHTAQQWPISEHGTRHWQCATRLSLSGLELQTDDILQYRIVALDYRQPEPNIGIGRTWSITVSEPNQDRALLATETRRLLEALKRILALQRENRTDLDMDREIEPLRARQQRIRDLTGELIDQQQRALRPAQSIIGELQDLATGAMLQALQALARYEGTYQQRQPLKQPLLEIMDEIIERLLALIGSVERNLGSAAEAQEALEKLTPEERDQALKRIHDLLEKLRDFMPEQDKVIAETEELVRKGDDLTHDDLQAIERLRGTEDKWAEVFTESVRDIGKLTEQGFADETIANDYREMVEQIEEASKNLTPNLIELAVPREQSGRELAESLVEEMEMWLPNSPDHIKWIMEEPLDFPEIPMVDLPEQLWDLIGDLIEEQDDLNDAAEDITSAWADSLAEGAGWEVAGGPISNFSAVGKTGNQLPDNNELSGRSGDGRSGRSQGQLVENIAKGLSGRQTPTRVTNDPYEQGVVKELQQMATGGATGGGKARGAGQEGLQGQSPPPLFKDLKLMSDWQQRIRQKAERVAGQLKMIRIELPEFEHSLELMRQAEQAAEDGRYAELFKIQQMVLQQLKMTGELAAREVVLRIDRAYHLPADQRRRILDAMDEPVPREYQDAVRRYFLQLSESE